MHTIFSMSNYKAVSWNTTVRAAMLRRSRDGRARHLADAMAMIQTSDGEEREHHTETRMSEPESEVDYLQNSQTVSEAAALPSTVPVTGESFCPCYRQEEISPGLTFSSDCPCGEEDQDFDWEWDDEFTSTGVFLSCDNRKVSFHSDYSCGTAAIRGRKELAEGQHFFEVKMTSPVYGTDMMVGIGTSEVNLEKFKYSFGSLLGHDADSWGLSYTGHLHHKGDKVKFSSKFGQGSIIGVHLDTWHGTLTFYKNRRCIGVAATHLQNKKLYPMVCSTAAKSSMKVIRACYTPTSLQYLCCTRIRQLLPSCLDILSSTDLPPGLKTRLQLQLGWIFTLSSSAPAASEQHWDSPEDFQQASGLLCSRSPSPVSTLSAYDSASPCTSPLPDTAPQQCACRTSAHSLPCTCHCPPTPPSSDHDSCCSEPEDYQCKRCRWA